MRGYFLMPAVTKPFHAVALALIERGRKSRLRLTACLGV